MTTTTPDQKPRVGRLEAALSWAHIFILQARYALEGHPNQLPRAAAQLYFAIEQIDGKPQQPCGHDDFYRHEQTGECVHPDCLVTK